jgi:hypothetical protein
LTSTFVSYVRKSPTIPQHSVDEVEIRSQSTGEKKVRLCAIDEENEFPQRKEFIIWI